MKRRNMIYEGYFEWQIHYIEGLTVEICCSCHKVIHQELGWHCVAAKVWFFFAVISIHFEENLKDHCTKKLFLIYKEFILLICYLQWTLWWSANVWQVPTKSHTIFHFPPSSLHHLSISGPSSSVALLYLSAPPRQVRANLVLFISPL